MEQELNKEERELLQNQLLRGETLKWTGRPIPRYFTLQSSIILIAGVVSAVVFCAFMAGFLDLSEGWDGTATIITLFTIPFWGGFLAMLSAPLRQHGELKRTLYALTDKRAIICERKLFGKTAIKTFPVARDMVKKLKLKQDGSGDIILGYEIKSRDDERNPAIFSVPLGFLHLPRVKEVQDAIQNIIEENENND